MTNQTLLDEIKKYAIDLLGIYRSCEDITRKEMAWEIFYKKSFFYLIRVTLNEIEMIPETHIQVALRGSNKPSDLVHTAYSKWHGHYLMKPEKIRDESKIMSLLLSILKRDIKTEIQELRERRVPLFEAEINFPHSVSDPMDTLVLYNAFDTWYAILWRKHSKLKPSLGERAKVFREWAKSKTDMWIDLRDMIAHIAKRSDIARDLAKKTGIEKRNIEVYLLEWIKEFIKIVKERK